MTCFIALMLPLLLSLGNWQLQRGAYKRDLENQYLAKLTELPQQISAQTLSQPFQALRLSGNYRNEIFMVDNQISEGRTGYWVFQVFDEAKAGLMLVNRGFVASDGSRSLPNVNTPTQTVSFVATVWPSLGLIPAWGSQDWSDAWPKRIQRANVGRMAEIAGTNPVELRLEPGQPSVLEPAPFASRLSDDKHNGYAATWFGLAIVLLLGYLYLGFSPSQKNHGSSPLNKS